MHCLQALEWAVKLGWYHMDTFDLEQYEHYEKVENGDMNWIIPNKFLAFMTPSDHARPNDLSLKPEYYIPIFKKMGIGMVVRLNSKEYDCEKFIKSGIKHVDIFFKDGTCPSDVPFL